MYFELIENCIWCILQADTPRNGLIAMWKSSRPIKKGQQIFSNYGYKDVNAYDWYKNEWEEFKKTADEINIKVHEKHLFSKNEL